MLRKGTKKVKLLVRPATGKVSLEEHDTQSVQAGTLIIEADG